MHRSSFVKMESFVHAYLGAHAAAPLRILDFGSQVVDEQETSYRPLFERDPWVYVGLDIEPGLNVDLPVGDPFNWPVESDSVDVVISGQAFEHVDYFWVSAFEIGRVLKPGGVAVLIAPSSGPEHRFPIDCWRFYRDGFAAVASYLGFEVLDVFTDWDRAVWGDTILVMRKPVWDDAGRAAFATKLAHQKAVLSGEFVAAELNGAEPSPLASVAGGALTPLLDVDRRRHLPMKSRMREMARGVAERWPGGLRLYRRALRTVLTR